MNHRTLDQDEERRALARMSLLSEAGSWLTTTLDLDQTLQRIAALPVPVLANGCAVQLLEPGVASAPPQEPPFRQLVVAHVDKTIERRVQAMVVGWSRALHRSFGALEVVRTGQPQTVDSLLHEQGAGEGEESEPSLMRELAAQSYLAVPLCARGALIGVLTLVQSDPTHPQREPQLASDLGFIGELSERASAAIDNALLYQRAQRAIAVRDDILAVVSHDLQSPLNAISMTAKLLLGEPALTGNPGARRALELIERTTIHIGQLIAELQDVGSIQAGRLAVELRPTALPALIADALALLGPLFADKQLRVSTQLESELPLVSCDGERVLRVLINLLGNAIKFNEQGGEVVIAARAVDQQVEVSVRDTGPGIAREDLSKLFEPYWRSRQAGRRGLGLGLYIARGIVEAHGGQVWAESELGAGSTFVLRLAIAPAESKQPE